MRTESSFDPQDKSPATAVGLMQVTPESARDTAGRFHATYDWKRMVCDPIYNVQMGAGELAGLLRDYRGSYMMTFAGYNAGRGRVAEWVKAHGDPRTLGGGGTLSGSLSRSRSSGSSSTGIGRTTVNVAP